MKGCFSIETALRISAMPCCIMSSFRHRAAFSGYGTSEEGHAKRTGRRGHLMQQKTAGKEFSFGRFWSFDSFWLDGWFLDVWYGVFEGL